MRIDFTNADKISTTPTDQRWQRICVGKNSVDNFDNGKMCWQFSLNTNNRDLFQLKTPCGFLTHIRAWELLSVATGKGL